MAKKKRSRTSAFSFNDSKNKRALPTKEEIETTISKVAPVGESSVSPTKTKRIPFTTALTPLNRALLETASHQSKVAIADLLNEALTFYFEEKRTANNEDMLAVFLKIYEAKAK
jgi:hypothetical protein